MGSGVSKPNTRSSTDRFQNPEQREREERRLEIMDKYKLLEKDKNRILAYPVFRIPLKNMVDNHVIEYVFFGVKEESCTEVTVFFQDKEHEKEIVERQGMNFSMLKDDSRQAYSMIAFTHTWSADETWDSPPNDESHTFRVPYAEFEKQDPPKPAEGGAGAPRPVIYVNTATHLLGNKNNNTDLEMATVSDYPMYAGTAKQATEVLLKACEAANPDKKAISPLASLIPVRTTHAPPKSAKEREKKAVASGSSGATSSGAR
eukprot:RCo047249